MGAVLLINCLSRLRIKFRFFRVVAGIAVLFSVSAVCGYAQQAQTSDSSQKPTGDAVADAARKAREKQKETAKPKKVFTNDDMSSLPANAVSSVGANADNDKDAGAKDQANAGDKEKKDDPETMWRKRFADAHAKLDQLQKELDILQREESKAQVQYYADPQKGMTQGYTRQDINDADAKIAAKKQEIEQQKQSISDLEDELRKAGGDPGWASPR
jgi:chromosome segregation ATPase